MTIIINTCPLKVWYLTNCCHLFRLLYVYLNLYSWKSCWSLAREFEISLLPIAADFEVDFYLYWFTFVVKIFCTRYLFVRLCYACKVVVQINGLSVKSWSQKGHMLCIFSCNVECIFCNWRFWICVWPICAKQGYLQTFCPLFHVIVLRHTLLKMCSVQSVTAASNCRITSVPTPKGIQS
jgi:hypothetical protein